MLRVLTVIVVLEFAGLNPLQVLAVQDADAIQTLFSSIIGPIITGATFEIWNLELLVSGAFVLTLVSFVVLISFILQIATVA